MSDDALAVQSKTYARGHQEAVLEYKPNDDGCPYLVTYWTVIAFEERGTGKVTL